MVNKQELKRKVDIIKIYEELVNDEIKKEDYGFFDLKANVNCFYSDHDDGEKSCVILSSPPSH